MSPRRSRSTAQCPPRAPRPAVAALAVLAACSAGGPTAARPPTTAAPVVAEHAAARRTVVEHAMAGATVVVTVLEADGNASATMHVVTDGAGTRTLVAEERVVGNHQYVRLPAAEAVLGADVWIRFDLTDGRHRSYLADHPLGLIAQAGPHASAESAGDRAVRREVLDPPPTIEPPAADVVAFDDLHELPDLRLPIGG